MVLARQEPGCIFLYASEAADERGTIVVFERFRDPDEFNEILQRDYAQRYLKLSESAYAAPGAMSDTDSIARLGRAVAVTLIAATQRPTQKAMGQGAVRSQMDLRICFRVREPRDVDLILGQGMLRTGWDAHNLNAPGKFLVSAPGHDRPKRARGYLLTDEVVTETAARYASHRPHWHSVRAANCPACGFAVAGGVGAAASCHAA